MKKDLRIEHLTNVLSNNTELTNEQKIALEETINILETSQDPKKILLALDILLKLIGIGSKFFDK